jgi:hypothetical protein
MASKKPVLGLALDRTEDGRLARITVPDPRKTNFGSRLSQRLLPQVPHVATPSTRMRHTAGTRRGSR